MSSKILLLDIETAPKVAYVWRFFKEHIGAKQVLEHGHIISYAAKWLGETYILYQENRKSDDKIIVRCLIDLLNEADIVIAHNGVGFDFAQISGRALVHGLKPPSPYKVVDTLKVAKKEFGFPSNSLEYLADVLGCRPKKSHKKFPGFELWLECLRNNQEAWEELKSYNISDVLTLEEVYMKMRPWIKDHPNVAITNTDEDCHCPKCNSKNLQWRGYAYTNAYKYHRFQCNDCGGWGRTRFNLNDKETNKNIVTNQVN